MVVRSGGALPKPGEKLGIYSARSLPGDKRVSWPPTRDDPSPLFGVDNPAVIRAYGHGRQGGSPKAAHCQKRGGHGGDRTVGSIEEVLQLHQGEGIGEGGGGNIWLNAPSSTPLTKQDKGGRDSRRGGGRS
jgi:hypothetical protein